MAAHDSQASSEGVCLETRQRGESVEGRGIHLGQRELLHVTLGEIIQRFPVFEQVSAATMAHIRSGATRADLQKGEHAFREADRLDRFALIGWGCLRVYRTGSGDREITLYRVVPGQVCLVNTLAVLVGEPAVASAVAEERTEMACFSADDLHAVLAESRSFRDFLFGTTLGRLIDVLHLLREVALETVATRLASHLLRRASATPVGLVLRATHEEVATELGTAREVVSRILKNFERSGLVALSRSRVEIRDVERLRALVDEP